ncbi:MAG: helix-turn-helix transcriptional regulator [Thermoleophilia bacterium]|nr:helix-turn-helix transcriptional regulator [Thermoleophilia bacterium]
MTGNTPSEVVEVVWLGEVVGGLIERLRSYQVARGLTDEQLASELGVSQSTWTRIRRGELGAGARVLSSALELLGLKLVDPVSDGGRR